MQKVLNYAETSATRAVNVDSVMIATSHTHQVAQSVNQLVIAHNVNHVVVVVVAVVPLVYLAYATTSVTMVHVNSVMNADSSTVTLTTVTSPLVALPAKHLANEQLVSATNSKSPAPVTTKASADSATMLPSKRSTNVLAQIIVVTMIVEW